MVACVIMDVIMDAFASLSVIMDVIIISGCHNLNGCHNGCYYDNGVIMVL